MAGPVKSFHALREQLRRLEERTSQWELRVPDARVLDAAIKAGPAAHYHFLDKMFSSETVMKRPDFIETEIARLRAKLRGSRRRRLAPRIRA